MARLIPARAGNTSRRRARSRRASAHPRSRGEHTQPAILRSGRVGSSPLARGTQLNALKSEAVERLIPARAGNTTGSESTAALCAAHPRSRGEHCRAVTTTAPGFGSSPLARGTLRLFRKVALCVRLIPARAGNTRIELMLMRGNPAHPRSRGEHR